MLRQLRRDEARRGVVVPPPLGRVDAGVLDHRHGEAARGSLAVGIEGDDARVLWWLALGHPELQPGIDLLGRQAVVPPPGLRGCARVLHEDRGEATLAAGRVPLEMDDARVQRADLRLQFLCAEVVEPVPAARVGAAVVDERDGEPVRRGGLDVERDDALAVRVDLVRDEGLADAVVPLPACERVRVALRIRDGSRGGSRDHGAQDRHANEQLRESHESTADQSAAPAFDARLAR